MEKKYLSRDKIVGKQVIDSNAIIVGNVKDMSFDLSSKTIALIIAPKNGDDIVVESKQIMSVGDVVLLNTPLSSPVQDEMPPPVKPQDEPPPPQTSLTPGLCGACGYQNEETSNFCIKCGTKL